MATSLIRPTELGVLLMRTIGYHDFSTHDANRVIPFTSETSAMDFLQSEGVLDITEITNDSLFSTSQWLVDYGYCQFVDRHLDLTEFGARCIRDCADFEFPNGEAPQSEYKFYCQNCGMKFVAESEFDDDEDWDEKCESGDTVPYGMCPECEASVHAITPTPIRTELDEHTAWRIALILRGYRSESKATPHEIINTMLLAFTFDVDTIKSILEREA